MTKRRILTTMFIGVTLLASCAGNIPSVKDLPEIEKTELYKPSQAAYIIGPGDVLAVDIWKEPDLSKQVTVRLDGKISLPLANDVNAAGLTCNHLQVQLTETYKGFVEVPQVSVTLLESRSTKIYVLGKINNAGEYPLQKKMTVVQAISLAGGLDRWADTSDIRLIRKINGVERSFRIDYDAVVSGKDMNQNVQLQPDDTIFVP